MRTDAEKLYRFVKWRNLVEYAAAVIVVASFGAYIFTRPHLLEKIGAGLIVLAALYVPWQLHRRASAVPLERAGTMPILEFSRLQLFVVGNAGTRANETTAIVPLGWGAWAFLAFFAVLLF